MKGCITPRTSDCRYGVTKEMSHWHAEEGGSALIESKGLENVGRAFIDSLAKMKHNGAIEKCVAGVTALTEKYVSETFAENFKFDLKFTSKPLSLLHNGHHVKIRESVFESKS